MSLRAMQLRYNTLHSPARLLTRQEQLEIIARERPSPPPPPPEPQPVQEDTETAAPLPQAFYAALNAVLRHGATNNLGPTRCARLNYIWFVTAAMAYQWTQPATAASRITGTKDQWQWNAGSPLKTNKDQCTWMVYMWEIVMPLIAPSYTADTVAALERAAYGWTVEQQGAEQARVAAEGDWTAFWAAWQTWWAGRQTDGAVEAAVPPTDAQLPNGGTMLEVSDGAQDPNTFTAPTKWTPLKVGTKTQKYLTWDWMSVRSSALSFSDGNFIQSEAKKAFLTDPVAKAAEIAEVLAISQTLTDTQKATAELWAGGPGTVSPPGMMIWFWRVFMQSRDTAPSWDTLVYSGLDLAAHIFETSRLVWGVKKFFMEARPIQYIRATHRGESITLYDGTATTGEHWVPFQESDFVTPPFADFPSGHSAFSQSFANVMTDWFGAAIPALAPTTLTDLSLLSPALATNQTQAFGTLTFPAGASLIQPAASVPAAPVTFTWSTWQEMADDAGISRKYGGIHATSAHVGSQALANALHGRLVTRWGIPRV